MRQREQTLYWVSWSGKVAIKPLETEFPARTARLPEQILSLSQRLPALYGR
jgi:hypothetical protein